MGILANHVPSVEALKAGVVEVIEDAGAQPKKWFGEFLAFCPCLATLKRTVSTVCRVEEIVIGQAPHR
jgi:hypothetical protein